MLVSTRTVIYSGIQFVGENGRPTIAEGASARNRSGKRATNRVAK